MKKESSRANNGVKKDEEAIRQRAQDMTSDMASSDIATRERAAQEFKKQDGLTTSNGTPPAADPGSHRRH